MASVLNNVFVQLPRSLDQPVRQHLKNVYACLTLSAMTAAFGAFAHIYTMFSLSAFFSSLAALGLIFALFLTPPSGKNTILRIGYLLGASFCIGMGMGPLIEYAMKINPNIIVSALLGTSLIFACFTLSVLYARTGYWLFLLGPLSSLGSILVLLSFGNIFFGSYLIYQINIYLGLMMMCAFVLFDTTKIIEKFRMGDRDFVLHSLDLFIDFIGIFKRILIILAEKERDSRERKRN